MGYAMVKARLPIMVNLGKSLRYLIFSHPSGKQPAPKHT